jgi:hypothetical protein
MKLFKLCFLLITVLAIVSCDAESDTEKTASIIGANDITIEFGLDFDPLEGIVAMDTKDGAIPVTEITVEGEIDTRAAGTYTFTYKVIGSDGKEVTVTRKITVKLLVCGDNQEEQNGECVIIDQDLDDIKTALNNTSVLTNYQLDVLISYTENTVEHSYEMTLNFDDQISMFEMGDDDITYYEKTATGMNAYIKQGDVYVMETVDQINEFSFYQELEPEWFTKINNYYILDIQYITNISSMLDDYFPDGSLNNFKVGLSDEHLDYFMFNVVSGEFTYQIKFTFDMIGEVELELPTA